MPGTYQVCAVILPVLFSTFTAGCESVPTGVNKRAASAPTVMSPPDEPPGTREYVVNQDLFSIAPDTGPFSIDLHQIGGNFLVTATDLAATPAESSETKDYGFATFKRHAKAVPWDIAGLFAGVTALGAYSWNWGNSSFHVTSEGWFGRNTGSLGVDKVGHAYAGYLITEILTDRIRGTAENTEGAEISALAITLGLMTYVELFDGFSGDHGFSYEDLIANTVGAGFSYLRRKIPGLREKVDFRLEYLPSGNVGGFHPITDYSGQKYLLALKFSGFEGTRDTPLRFLELHAGYYARGFTQAERDRFEPLRREPYVGIGINLGEVLFGAPSVRDTKPGKFGRRVLEYVQVPYTYLATSMD